MRIIPAIDMKNGSCVRLLHGEFDQQTEYSKDPAEVARKFEAFGCPDLHMVDLDGAQSGEQKNRELIRRIASETAFSIQLGGGIRDAQTVEAWLAAGVSRCVIGSVAITEPAVTRSWFDRFGPDRIVLALDVRINDLGRPMLATHGWARSSEVTLWQAVEDYLGAGLRHVLCTDISRDGALSGPSIELYCEFVNRYPGIQLQASGGVRNVSDLYVLRDTGAAAAITGRAILDGRIAEEEVSSFLHGE